ncbi:hypothetical protein [Corallococcus exiguus]|uniref:hypothetical protein n=1 Tax=Corallococcus exiguus TaxID=83462 RepID=UPI001C2721C4|nr:hypothetical protein [Corallococcus exiguus]
MLCSANRLLNSSRILTNRWKSKSLRADTASLELAQRIADDGFAQQADDRRWIRAPDEERRIQRGLAHLDVPFLRGPAPTQPPPLGEQREVLRQLHPQRETKP